MGYQIQHAVVIGSGTMGGAIAAHLANIGVRVHLLDIVPGHLTPDEKKLGLTLADEAVRNRIASRGLQAALNSKPASFYTERAADLIHIGNLDDHFDVIQKADWVIEVIIENLEIKKNLMERVDQARRPDSIISTNTSGIPVGEIASGRSESFNKHFLGTHFFNPPRYLKLLEIIPTEYTSSNVVEFMKHFGEYRLGKGVVICKDTPNFIANRLGFASGAFALDRILEEGFTVKQIDDITGPLIGRPKTATFRLLDLIGLDVWDHVGKNLLEMLPEDDPAYPYLQSSKVNQLIEEMIDKGQLGTKVGRGFYKQDKEEGKKVFYARNLTTGEYQPPEKISSQAVKEAKGMEKLEERLGYLMTADDPAANFIKSILLQGLAYASQCIPEIADTPKPIDDAMRWGFGHQAGPFEIWDMLGLKEGLEWMEEEGQLPGQWVQDILAEGKDSFYQYQGSQKSACYHPGMKDYQPLRRTPHLLVLDTLKTDQERLLDRNTSASLVDLGEGVACVEFQTKMNAIDEDTIKMMEKALDLVEREDLPGLVIGNDAENFSAGANLFGVVMAAQNQLWDQLDDIVRMLQNANMRMRYFPKPVVIAPAGLALGGGAEIIMHGSRVVAAAELYAGLVEIGAGVIPAGGGTKEMVRRVVNPPLRTEGALALSFLQQLFEQVGQGEVARSAHQAREFGILSEADRIIINRDHLLARAKEEVLHLAQTGYRPPLPEKIYAAGRDSLSALKVGLHLFREGGYITEYETVIGGKLIEVMTGGNLSQPAWLEEQYFLDLEREAFLSLCGEQKTQERMWNLLQTGKVLRN